MKKTTSVFITILILMMLLSSCNWAKDRTKKVVNKTGQVIGKTGSEFGDGIYKGVKKTFENEVKISDQLKAKGLEIGEVLINSSDPATDNVLIAYIIFNEHFDQEITIKVFTENGKEYGRLKENLKGEKDEAKHVVFSFDEHVNIKTKGNISIE